MSEVALIYTLYGDAGAAEAAARDAVGKGLAACANILAPCRSVYRWEGELHGEPEVPVLFKTRPDRREALRAHLAAGHPYAVPAILTLGMAGAGADFAAWVEGQCGPSD
jgi:periplasmic divalent cation tolerance protein